MVHFFPLSKRSTYMYWEVHVDLIKPARSQTPNQLSRVQTHVSFTWQVSSIPLTHIPSLNILPADSSRHRLWGSLFPPVPERFWTPEHLSLQAFFTHVNALVQMWSYSLLNVHQITNFKNKQKVCVDHSIYHFSFYVGQSGAIWAPLIFFAHCSNMPRPNRPLYGGYVSHFSLL